MTVINLSEFKEEHKVSLLLGAPPGYVGYGDGGILTEAVRRRPYSLALLDEVEKAHPGVQDIFYQVFDKGVLRDGQGRDVNFKNTVLILTSNVAGELITQLCADPKKAPDLESLIAAIRPELLKVFKPAFLARLTIVPYLPLTDDLMRQVVQLQLQRIVQRVNEHYAAELTYESSLVEAIAARCLEVQSGARNINHLLTGQLLPELSTRLLSRTAEDKKTRHIHISVNGEQGFEYRLT
jgi:type VI secretion system protein VasG